MVDQGFVVVVDFEHDANALIIKNSEVVFVMGIMAVQKSSNTAIVCTKPVNRFLAERGNSGRHHRSASSRCCRRSSLSMRIRSMFDMACLQNDVIVCD